MIHLADQLTRLADVGKQLSCCQSTAALYSRIFDLIEEIFENQSAAILLIDQPPDHVRLVSSRGYDSRFSTGYRIATGEGIVGQVVQTRQPILVSDTRENPQYIPGVNAAVSEMAVPLIIGEQFVGVLDMESASHRFSTADQSLFSAFADQVVTALRNLEFQSILEERAARLDAIARVGQSLNLEKNLEAILGRITDAVHTALRLETVSIQLVDKDTGELVVVSQLGYDRNIVGTRVLKGQGITGRAAALGQTVVVDDVRNEEDYIHWLNDCRSEMAIPLIYDGSVIGILNAEHRQEAFFDKSIVLHAGIFADQAANAIGNANMRSQLKKKQRELDDISGQLAIRTRRITQIHRAAASLNVTAGSEKPITLILKAALNALKFDTIALLIPSPEDGQLQVYSAINYPCTEGQSIPIDDGMAARVIATGEPGFASSPEALSGRRTGSPDATCEMAVPLIVDNTIIGVLIAESLATGNFDDEDLRLFRVFGSQAATALHNASMIQKLKDYTTRLHAINHAAYALNFSYDPSLVISEILRCVGEAFHVDECSLHVVEPNGRDLVLHTTLGSKIPLGTRSSPGRGTVGIAAAEGRPLLITNSTTDERCLLNEQKGPPSSGMVAPLIIKDKVIGVLESCVGFTGVFDRSDLDLFATFASHAAVAIHNANLIKGLEEANLLLAQNFDEMKRMNSELEQYALRIADANKSLEWQIQQLTAVHEAGRTITSSLDLDTTLKTILDMSASIAGSTAGAIKLFDEESRKLSIRAVQGSSVDETGSRTILSLPLSIGDKIIGEFEFIRSRHLSLSPEERRMLETMASQAAIAIENARLFESTQRVYYETLKTLTFTIEARDDYTRGHSERVADLSRMLATQMRLPKRDVENVFSAAVLHDIGKIGIRDDLLLAPRGLTDEERATIQQHPVVGRNILSPLKFLGEIRSFVHFHHERWDGLGYPEGRKGKNIPLASRIIAVADAFDAMTSTRPYREPLERDAAISEIIRASGTQFDPEVVKAFESCMATAGENR
jgi:HD-GYP domain-containing protein (c-di-GMP phosphodiesterase class II)/putative methionine-R-sulfoxide reductase with GAF domain